MARRVFFSFDYNDVSDFKVNVVRNSRALKNLGNSATFIDKSLWEEARNKSPEALKKLIDEGLDGTSVTVILVGTGTFDRRWVKYELVKSFVEGKGIVVIHINRIRSRTTFKITLKGINPLNKLLLKVDENCDKLYFYELKDKKWFLFQDLPSVNNRLKNSFYFDTGGFFTTSDCGKTFLFSSLFENEYCWVNDDGFENLPDWLEKAAEEVGR